VGEGDLAFQIKSGVKLFQVAGGCKRYSNSTALFSAQGRNTFSTGGPDGLRDASQWMTDGGGKAIVQTS